MTNKIIYPNSNGNITLIIPALECGLSVQEIARKDVPAGVPYLIIEESDLPEINEFYDAWEADFSNPDGYGIGIDAWFAEQAAKEQP